jgi:hypothetical protein
MLRNAMMRRYSLIRAATGSSTFASLASASPMDLALPFDGCAQYVGSYDLRLPENPTTPMLVEIQLAGDRLTMGAGPLVPLSQTVFAAGPIRVEFVVDDAGTAAALLVRVAKGDLRAVRLPAQPTARRP